MYIVRSHEVVMDGFESMSPYLKILFSTTDYCGKTQNVASIGIIKKNYDIVPKYITPLNNYLKDKYWFNSDLFDEFIGNKQSKHKTTITD